MIQIFWIKLKKSKKILGLPKNIYRFSKTVIKENIFWYLLKRVHSDDGLGRDQQQETGNTVHSQWKMEHMSSYLILLTNAGKCS